MTEIQKTTARCHLIAPKLLNWLWGGSGQSELGSEDGVVTRQGASELVLPPIPFLWRERGGFSLEFRVRFDNLTPHQILFDSRDEAGNGIAVHLTERGTLKLTLCGGLWSNYTQRYCNGNAESSWECDSDYLEAGKWHSCTVIVDGGPKLILCVVDGLLHDGGAVRPFGGGRFYLHLDNLNGAPQA